MARFVIKYIDSSTDLPPLEKCVLVAFGKTDALVQKGEH